MAIQASETWDCKSNPSSTLMRTVSLEKIIGSVLLVGSSPQAKSEGFLTFSPYIFVVFYVLINSAFFGQEKFRTYQNAR
jgi:hypothetical protein